MRRALFFIVAIFCAATSYASIPRGSVLDGASIPRASMLDAAPPFSDTLSETRIRVSDVLAPFERPLPSPLNRALHQAYGDSITTNASGLGRFLSVDPVLGDPTVPQSWNRYAYALNNPLRFTDPTGKYICDGNNVDCAVIEKAYTDLNQAAADLPEGSDERNRLSNVVVFLGPPGEENGVTVVVGDVGANPTAAGGALNQGDEVRLGINIDNIAAAVGGRDSHRFAPEIAGVLSHETQHGLDQSVSGMPGNLAQITALETNAFATQAATYRGLNFISTWRLWSPSTGISQDAIQRGAQRSIDSWCRRTNLCR
jgi:hypothetical protein